MKLKQLEPTVRHDSSLCARGKVAAAGAAVTCSVRVAGELPSLLTRDKFQSGLSNVALIFLQAKQMQTPVKSDATLMLAAVERGEPQAAEQLLALVYDELRKLAAAKLASEAPGQTLQPTALVHEAWLKLVGGGGRTFNDRTHFFRASAEAMRRILIDRARRKRAQRHGGNYEMVELEGIDMAAPNVDGQMLAVNEALDKMVGKFPVQAELVKLRYFMGMTNEEVAEVLNISVSTTKNYWNFARAWLLEEIRSQ
jgi:RNA polymerase sigma factor (TIGR02999 family)